MLMVFTLGLDCVYSGAGRTNSSAIVGGEIARSAANAVVGAVSGRLSAAMNMLILIQQLICLIHLMVME